MVAREKKGQRNSISVLDKAPTGINGLDEITCGGLPKGRTTLVAGGAGSGKTIFAMEFLLRGAVQYNEPGVFVAFEENPHELAENFASMGYDLDDLIKRKKIAVEHIAIERSQIEETGEYDLEALFIRLAYAAQSIGAKRMVLDTIEVLFSGLQNVAVLRAELRRLFRWMKDRNLSGIVT
ncbi:MAG: KaiC 1, partial [Deltaproteobacteria bacterium HGW-Deltaproteobacteria-21]